MARGAHFSRGISLKLARIKGGAAGSLTVTGAAVGDQILAVQGIGKMSGTFFINTTVDFTSEFSVTAANTIDNTGGTTTSNWLLLVAYEDVNA